MAKGDAVQTLQDIANGANLDYQPSAGVEVLITEFTWESLSTTTVRLYDGSLGANQLMSVGGRRQSGPTKMFINNTRYLRISNASGSNNELGFTGIQTK